jgi:hypothetical protein
MKKESIEPIPVMFSYTSQKGPWQLGYIHPDDLPKITPTDPKYDSVIVNIWERDLEVYEMDNGIPAIPMYVVPLEKFKAPDWKPEWNWDVYCENRKNNK